MCHRISHFCGARRKGCATESHFSVAHPSGDAPQNFSAPTYMWALPAPASPFPNFANTRAHAPSTPNRRPPHHHRPNSLPTAAPAQPFRRGTSTPTRSTSTAPTRSTSTAFDDLPSLPSPRCYPSPSPPSPT